MASSSDLLLSVGLDTSPALRAVNDFARSVKPVNLKFNSQPLGTISKDINTFRESLRAAEIRTVAFASAAGQLFAVQRAFQAITKSTIETEKSLTDINVVLGLSQKQLAQFSSGLFKVANETGASFQVAADGAVELSRQGLSAAETLKRLKDALTLTRLSGLDVGKSVSAITAAINSFNDAALDSTAIVNKLASVDAQFAVSSGDLADSLSRVGSTARDTGVSFDELIGFITAAKQITQRDGSVIGNALKTIFQRIQRPEVLDNLRELGVLTRTVNGETLGSQQILVNLAKTYSTLSSAQQNQVVQLSAGVYQANQFRAILNDLSKENSIYARAVGVSSSATDQAARRQTELNKTLAASINETVNKLTQVSAKVGDLTLKPVFDTILGQIKSGADLLSGSVGDSGATVGSTLGEGILKGIGNYLSGPGLILGGALIFKLIGSFASTAIKSLGTILETGTSRVRQEEAIRNLLSQQTGLMGEILALGGNQGEIEKRIGLAISQNNAALNQQLKVVSEIAAITSSGLAGRNLSSKPFTVKGGNITRAAVGIIPSIQESIGAIQAGYKPGKIKQLNVPRLGNVVYNDAEKVKYFPGLSQPAIIPPQNSKAGINYNKEFISAHGFSPYKAEGHIPNFARETRSLARGLGLAGLPKDILLSSHSDDVTKALTEGRFDLRATKDEKRFYGNSYNVAVSPRMSAGIRRYPTDDVERFSRFPTYYDRRIATINNEPLFEGSDFRVNKARLKENSGYSKEIQMSPEDGYLFRGMSFEEFQQIRKNRFIQSRGDFNLLDSDKGHSYFSTDPRQAANYAGNFAPWQLTPTFRRPSFVVRVKGQGEIPPGFGSDTTERRIAGKIPSSLITDIAMVRPYAMRGGDFELYKEYRDESFRVGSRSSPIADLAYRQLNPKDYFNKGLVPNFALPTPIGEPISPQLAKAIKFINRKYPRVTSLVDVMAIFKSGAMPSEAFGAGGETLSSRAAYSQDPITKKNLLQINADATGNAAVRAGDIGHELFHLIRKQRKGIGSSYYNTYDEYFNDPEEIGARRIGLNVKSKYDDDKIAQSEEIASMSNRQLAKAARLKIGNLSVVGSKNNPWYEVWGGDAGVEKIHQNFDPHTPLPDRKKAIMRKFLERSAQSRWNNLSSGLLPSANKGLVPNFFPQISKLEALKLLRSKNFQGLTYQKKDGSIENYSQAQHHVRRDKLVGAPPPAGYDSYGQFDDATQSLVLHSIKSGQKPDQAEFRRFLASGIKSIRAGGQDYTIGANGIVPNFAPYGHWTSPSGVMQEVAYEGHTDAARIIMDRLLAEKKITKEKRAELAEMGGYRGLSSLGYLRGYTGSGSYYTAEAMSSGQQPTTSQARALKNYGIENKRSVRFEGFNEVPDSDGFLNRKDYNRYIYTHDEFANKGMVPNYAYNKGKRYLNPSAQPVDVNGAVDQLSREEKRIFLGLINGTPLAQIASTMGMPQNEVAKKYEFITARLRGLIGQDLKGKANYSEGMVPNFNIITPELVQKVSPEILSTFTKGGDLLKYIKSLGLKGKAGSSRLFLPLTSKIGLKVALNKAGVAQNETEFPILGNDYYARQQYDDILPQGHKYDENNFLYGFMERLSGASAKDFRTATGKPKRDFLKDYATTGKLSEIEEQIVDFARNYDLNIGDFLGGRNVGLGQTSSGKTGLKLLDVGASERVMREFYQKRNLGAFGQTRKNIPISFRNKGLVPNYSIKYPPTSRFRKANEEQVKDLLQSRTISQIRTSALNNYYGLKGNYSDNKVRQKYLDVDPDKVKGGISYKDKVDFEELLSNIERRGNFKASQGMVPNYAYIPGITPLIGRYLTNIVNPTGYDIKNKIGEMRRAGLKGAFNAIVRDKPTPGMASFIESGNGRMFPYRKMFGLDPGERMNNAYTKNEDGTYSFNNSSITGARLLDRVRESQFRSPNNVKLMPDGTESGTASYHEVMGNFDKTVNLKENTVSYNDRWDFDFNNKNDRLSVRSAIDNIKYLYKDFKQRGNNADRYVGSLKDRFKDTVKSYAAQSDSGLSSLARLLVGKVTSPITIRGSTVKDEYLDTDLIHNGLVPNYSALSSAIKRENAAGIPMSKIRVGSSPLIKSNRNPLGLGVYNIEDEPLGLNQGVQRVASMGLDPKKAGIPNYAKYYRGINDIQDNPTDGIRLIEGEALKSLEAEINKYKEQIRIGTRDQAGINTALETLTKNFNLTSESSKKIADRFKKTLTRSVSDQNRNKGVVRNQLTGSISDLEPDQLDFGSFQKSNYGTQGEFVGVAQQVDLANKRRQEKRTRERQREYEDQLLGVKSKAQIEMEQLNAKAPTPNANENQRVLEYARNKAKLSITSTETEADVLKENKRILSEAKIAGATQEDINKIARDARERRLQAVSNERKRLIEKNRLEVLARNADRGEYDNRPKTKAQIEEEQLFYSDKDYQRNSNIVGKINKFSQSSSSLSDAKKLIKEIRANKTLTETQINEQLSAVASSYGKGKQLRFTRASEDAYKNQGFLSTLFGIGKARENERLYGNTQAAQANRNSFQNKAFLASFALPTIAGIGEQTILNSGGSNSTTGRGLAKTVGSLGTIASSILTGASIGGPIGIGIAAAGVIPEIINVINAFTDTLPDLQRELEGTIEATKRTSDSFSSYIGSAEQLQNFSGNKLQYRQLQNINAVSLASLTGNAPGRKDIIKSVSAQEFDKAREIQASNDYNNNLLVRLQQDQVNFKDKGYSSNDQKIIDSLVSTSTQRDYESSNSTYYGGPTPDRSKYEDLISQDTIKFFENSDFIQNFRSNFAQVLGSTYFTPGKNGESGKINNTLDLLQKSGLSSTVGVESTLSSLDKAIKSTTDIGLIRNLEQLKTPINEIKNNENFDSKEKDKQIANLINSVFKNFTDSLISFKTGATKSGIELDNLSQKLLQFSKNIIDSNYSLEKNAIIQSANLSGTISKKEFDFAGQKQLTLAANPNNLKLENQLNTKEALLKNTNIKDQKLQSSSQLFIGETSKAIIDSYESELNKLKEKALGTGIDKAEKNLIGQRIDSLTSLLNNNETYKSLKNKSQEGNLTEADVNAIAQQLENQSANAQLLLNISDSIDTAISQYKDYLKESGSSAQKQSFGDFYNKNLAKEGDIASANGYATVPSYVSSEFKDIPSTEQGIEDYRKKFYARTVLARSSVESATAAYKAKRDKENRDLTIANEYQQNAKNIGYQYNNTDASINDQYTREDILRLSERQLAIKNTNRNNSFEIKKITANPLQLNQLTARNDLAESTGIRLQQLRRSGDQFQNIKSVKDIDRLLKENSQKISGIRNDSGYGNEPGLPDALQKQIDVIQSDNRNLQLAKEDISGQRGLYRINLKALNRRDVTKIQKDQKASSFESKLNINAINRNSTFDIKSLNANSLESNKIKSDAAIANFNDTIFKSLKRQNINGVDSESKLNKRIAQEKKKGLSPDQNVDLANLIAARKSIQDNAKESDTSRIAANKLEVETLKRNKKLSSFESKLNVNAIQRKSASDIQSLKANPYQLNQIKADEQVATFNDKIFTDLKASNITGVDLKPIDSLSKIQEKIAQIKKEKENSIGLDEDQDSILQSLINAEAKIKENIDESNESRIAANKLDEKSLKFAENRARALRTVNQGKASLGEGSSINQVDNLTSGLQFTSTEFWDTMSQNNEKFGEDFKNTFKEAFGSAIQNGESLGKALEKSFLNFANNIAVKNVNLALDSIFGAVFDGLSKVGIGGKSGGAASGQSSILTDLLGSLFSSGKANGGLIQKFASGGFVNMGSGTKDDVPALLSGGEYVIRKSSVNKIGKGNLDRINGYAGGGSFIKKFDNEFATTGDPLRPTDGAFNIDSNLSSIAQTDENNPQNALKFARENYIYDKRKYDADNKKTLAKYEKNQKTSAYIAFGSAVINAGLSAYASKGTGTKGQQADAKLVGTSAKNAQYLPVDGAAGGNIYRYNNQYFSTNGIHAAKGGLIRGFAQGGMFGADSSMDKYPAMLMGGEYVVKKPVVDTLGTRFFDAINKTGRPPHGFADGGYVGTSSIGKTEDVSKYFAEFVSVSKEIRDTLGGKQSGGAIQSAGVNISVNTNITIAGNGEQSQSTTVTSNESESKKDNKQSSFTNEDAKKLSDSINAQINQALVKESKNGGILYERFKTRA